MFFHGSTAPFGDPPRQADHFRSRAPLRSITRLARFPRFLVAYAASLMSCMPRQFSFPGVANSAIHLCSVISQKLGGPPAHGHGRRGYEGGTGIWGKAEYERLSTHYKYHARKGTLKLGVVSRWNHWERNLERPVTSRVFIARRATNWGAAAAVRPPGDENGEHMAGRQP